MREVTIDQIRSFRLRSHHLDSYYPMTMLKEAAGVCGFQNSPPGAWETAVFNRICGITKSQLETILYDDRSLIQAWSYRGAPIVFPVIDSDVFLSGLIPQGDEPWIYTKGIGLALDFLGMNFKELHDILKQVLVKLDNHVLISKNVLDQTLADWMTPLLPEDKQTLWRKPSMYGNPNKQTVGGAAVSFLLRPCSYQGQVVFGKRIRTLPSFTSYKKWTGDTMKVRKDADFELVRRFLHAYGPASLDAMVSWLGCSKEQGMRMWKSIDHEIMPVRVLGKTRYILKADEATLFTPAKFTRDLILLGGHDPYLDLRDRTIIQKDKQLQKQIWKLVSNPGVVLRKGEAVGIWHARRKNNRCAFEVTLWEADVDEDRLCSLADAYAAFQNLQIHTFEIKKVIPYRE